jgi:hypothetical protein
MRKTFGFIAESIAVIFVALFVVTALLAVPLSTAGWRLFGPNLYKRALAEQAIYERAPALAGEQITRSITYGACAENPDCPERERGKQAGGEVSELLDPGITPFFLLNLTQEDFESIIAGLAPPRWLQEQIESVIGQTLAYLNLSGDPQITVSLIAFKQRLVGDEGTRAFMRMAMAQPLCTPGQVALVGSDEDIAPEDMPICRPPEPLRERYADRAHETLQAVAATSILDQVDVITVAEEEGVPISLPEEPASWRDDPRVEFQIVKWSLRLSPFVPLVLLLLATLAAVRSWGRWARWWSIPLLIVGVVGLLLAVAALPANLALCAYGAAQVPAEFSRGVVDAGLGVEKTIVRSLVTSIAIESGILTLLGLLLFALAALLRRGSIEDYD